MTKNGGLRGGHRSSHNDICKKEVAHAQSLHQIYVSFSLNQAKHLQIKLSEKQHHYSAKQHCFVGMLAQQAHKCVVAK